MAFASGRLTRKSTSDKKKKEDDERLEKEKKKEEKEKQEKERKEKEKEEKERKEKEALEKKDLMMSALNLQKRWGETSMKWTEAISKHVSQTQTETSTEPIQDTEERRKQDKENAKLAKLAKLESRFHSEKERKETSTEPIQDTEERRKQDKENAKLAKLESRFNSEKERLNRSSDLEEDVTIKVEIQIKPELPELPLSFAALNSPPIEPNISPPIPNLMVSEQQITAKDSLTTADSTAKETSEKSEEDNKPQLWDIFKRDGKNPAIGRGRGRGRGRGERGQNKGQVQSSVATDDSIQASTSPDLTANTSTPIETGLMDSDTSEGPTKDNETAKGKKKGILGRGKKSLMKVKLPWKRKQVKFSPSTNLENENKPKLQTVPAEMKKISDPKMRKDIERFNKELFSGSEEDKKKSKTETTSEGAVVELLEFDFKLDSLLHKALGSTGNMTDDVTKQHMDAFKEYFKLKFNEEYSDKQTQRFKAVLTSSVLTKVAHVSAPHYQTIKMKLAQSLKKVLELSAVVQAAEEEKSVIEPSEVTRAAEADENVDVQPATVVQKSEISQTKIPEAATTAEAENVVDDNDVSLLILSDSQKETLHQILKSNVVHDYTPEKLKEELAGFMEKEALSAISKSELPTSSDKCMDSSHDDKDKKSEKEFTFQDVLKLGLVNLLKFDSETADQFVKNLGFLEPKTMVWGTRQQQVPLVAYSPSTSVESEEVPDLEAIPEKDVLLEGATSPAGEDDEDDDMQLEVEAEVEDGTVKFLPVNNATLHIRHEDNEALSLTETQKVELEKVVSEELEREGADNNTVQSVVDDFCQRFEIKPMKIKFEYHRDYVKSFSKPAIEAESDHYYSATEDPTNNVRTDKATLEKVHAAESADMFMDTGSRHTNDGDSIMDCDKTGDLKSNSSQSEKTGNEEDDFTTVRAPKLTFKCEEIAERVKSSVNSEEDISSMDDSYADPEFKPPKHTDSSESSDNVGSDTRSASPTKEGREEMDTEEHLDEGEKNVSTDEDGIGASIDEEAVNKSDKEVEDSTSDTSSSSSGTKHKVNFKEYMRKLGPIAPVDKNLLRLFKLKQARRRGQNLKDVLPPHRYSTKKLGRDQVLKIARTCKNPYSLGPAFIEPSRKGIYVYESTAPDGSDRGQISNSDAYLWNNKSKWVFSFNPAKRPHDAVVATSWFARTEGTKDTNEWQKTAYYVQSCDRYVIHYRGNPALGRRIGDLPPVDSDDTESHDSDVPKPGEKSKHRSSFSKSKSDLKTPTTGTSGSHESDAPPTNIGEKSGTSRSHESDAPPTDIGEKPKQSQSVPESKSSRKKDKERSAKLESQQSVESLYDDETSTRVGFQKATPFKVLKDPFKPVTCTEIRQWMTESEEANADHNAMEYVITNPAPGELYAFNVNDLKRNLPKWKDHIVPDTWCWKVHSTMYHYDTPLRLERNYYTCSQSKQFRKYIYYDMFSGKVMVHYQGDNSNAVRKPHGNSHESVTKPFIRTSSIVKTEIAKRGEKRPTEVFNETLTSAGPGLVRSLTTPRNVSQVKYEQQKHRDALKLSTDQLVAAVYVADAMGTFTRQIWAWPNRNVLLISDQSLENFKEVLRNMPEGTPLVLGYDTTFEYGEFFVSVLNYRHPLMKNVKEGTHDINHEPVIPLAIFVHQRRPEADHKQGFSAMQEVLQRATKDINPSFNTVPKIFLADREFKDTTWPETKILYCWSHLEQNCKEKLRKLGFDKKQQDAFKIEFENAMRSRSEESYENKITRYNSGEGSDAWTHAKFMTYYNKHIDQTVKENCGRWVLEDYNLPNANRGAYNNASESINRTLAKIRGDSKKTLDQSMIDFRYYADIYDYKVLSAFYGQEPYQLKEEFQYLSRDPDNLPAALIKTPDQRLQDIRNFWNIFEEDFTREAPVKDVKRDYVLDTIQKEAQWLVESGKIELLKTQRHFSVETIAGKFLKVRLDPLSCDCGSKTICAHVLGVKHWIGAISDYSIPTKTKNRQNMGDRKKRMTGTKAHHKFELEHKGFDVEKKSKTMADFSGVESEKTSASDDSDSPARVISGKDKMALHFYNKVTTSAKKPKQVPVTRMDTPTTPKTPKTTPAHTPKSVLKKTPGSGVKRSISFSKDVKSPDFKRAKTTLFKDEDEDRTLTETAVPMDTKSSTESVAETEAWGAHKNNEELLKHEGYYFDNKLQLKIVHKGKETREKFKFNPYNRHQYETVALRVNDWVQTYLTARYRFQYVFTGDARFVLASEGYQDKTKLAILIHGNGSVRAGLWSRREAVNSGLEYGSQLPHILKLVEKDYGVICLNTNEKQPGEFASDPFEHASTVWNELINPSKAETIVIIAHSYGGKVTMHLAENHFDSFEGRVKRVLLADSAHTKEEKLSDKAWFFLSSNVTNYVCSKLKRGTRIETTSDFFENKSAGTTNHDLAPHSALKEMMKEIDSIKTTSKSPLSKLKSRPVDVLADSLLIDEKNAKKHDETLMTTTTASDDEGPSMTPAVSALTAPDVETKTTAPDVETKTTAPDVETETTAPDVEIVSVTTVGSSSDVSFVRNHAVNKFDLDSFQQNQMSIYTGQYKTFTDGKGAQLSVYCKEAGEAVAFYDPKCKDYSEEELRKFAAAVVSASVVADYADREEQTDAQVHLAKARDAKVHLAGAGQRDTPDQICKALQKEIEGLHLIIEKEKEVARRLIEINIKKTKSGRVVKKEVEDEFILPPGTALPEFEYTEEHLVCRERLPLASQGTKSEVVCCNGCAESFHTQCVSSDINKKTGEYECTTCVLPYNGVQWGNGNISDTCPVDNIFSYVALQETLHSDITHNLPEDTAAEILFKNCVKEAVSGNDSFIHRKIFKELSEMHNSPLTREQSLWGNPHDMVYNKLMEEAFVRHATCSDDCLRNGARVEEKGFYMVRDEDYREKIRDFERDALQPTVCSECTMPVTLSEVHFNDGRRPYMVAFNFEGCYIAPREAVERLPESVKIDNETFRLGMITVRQPKRSHFIGLMKHENGTWMTYDGLYNHNGLKTNYKSNKHRETKHFRQPFTSDWNTPFSVLASAEYFKESRRKPLKQKETKGEPKSKST